MKEFDIVDEFEHFKQRSAGGELAPTPLRCFPEFLLFLCSFYRFSDASWQFP